MDYSQTPVCSVQWGRSLAKPPVNSEIYLGPVTLVGRGLRSLMRGLISLLQHLDGGGFQGGCHEPMLWE